MPRYGAWLGAILCLIALALVADVAVVDGAQHNVHESRTEVLSDRVVDLDRVPARAGDVLRVWPERDVPAGALGAYEMWILEGGDGESVADTGEPPAASYRYVGGLHVGAFRGGPVEFVRPTAAEGAPGQEIDIVWIYRYAEGVTPPSDGDARTYFERWIGSQLGASEINTVVLERQAVAFHRVVSFLMPALAIAALVVGILWVQRLLGQRVALRAEEPTASLVSLVNFAGGYLGYLRGLLLGLAFPLVLVVWLALLVIGNYPASLVGPPGWQRVLDLGLGVGVAVLLAGWLLSAWFVSRAHRRWRAAAAQAPWME